MLIVSELNFNVPSVKCDTAAQLEGEQLALLRVAAVNVHSEVPEILQHTEKFKNNNNSQRKGRLWCH